MVDLMPVLQQACGEWGFPRGAKAMANLRRPSLTQMKKKPRSGWRPSVQVKPLHVRLHIFKQMLRASQLIDGGV